MSLLYCLLVLCFSEINLLLESSHCDGPNHLVIRGFHCLCQWVVSCQVLPKTGVWACSDDRYNDKLGGRSCINQERKGQLIAVVSKCALYVFNVIPTRLPYPCNFITVLIVNQEQEQTTLLFWSNACRESVFLAAHVALLSLRVSEHFGCAEKLSSGWKQILIAVHLLWSPLCLIPLPVFHHCTPWHYYSCTYTHPVLKIMQVLFVRFELALILEGCVMFVSSVFQEHTKSSQATGW